LTCRAINSSDASACEQFKTHPKLAVQLPMFRPQMQVTQAISSALDQSIRRNGLIGGPHDLGRALKIALEVLDPAESWLHGEQLFHPALAQDKLTEERPPAAVVQHQSYHHGLEPIGNFDPSGLKLFEHLWTKGECEEALRSVNGSHPGYQLAKIRLPLGYKSEADVLHWREIFERSLDEFAVSKFDPREAYDGLSAFRYHELSYQQFNNRDILAKIGDLLCNGIAAKALPELSSPIKPRRASGKIRIGYAGYDLRESSVSPWTLGWLTHHAKEFETFAINLGEIQDRTTAVYERLADHYLHLPRRGPVPKDARVIKSLGLDVLIYLDVGTKARTNQLACLRLAPVQCATWGSPESSGLPTIDYYLSSTMMEPEDAEEHYTERLVRLPKSGICYLKESGRISYLEKRDFGITKGPLVVSFQPPSKFDPRYDHLYQHINEGTGEEILIVERHQQDQSIVRERLAKAGVRARYVRQLSLADYRGLMRIADVVLDTPGWNGGITTIQSLDAGTPVVTKSTNLRRGKQSSCFLELAGGHSLIAKDDEEYGEFAVDADGLHAARRALDPERLYDDIAAVRAFEDFLRAATA
jgi:predicted O-linked N-acetylglucosamine transferase (SPINDLY family)